MSSPERNRKRLKKTTPNPSLPDNLLVTCLARVSKLYYPTLSLVSKSFQSLLGSPERNMKTVKNTIPNPSLPDDLLITCLARVSRLYYPTLSLVSKSFRSLLASPELYKTRSLLSRTESCLYVCLHFYPEAKLGWFTLIRKPDRTLTKSSGYLLVPVASPQSHPAHVTGYAAVGSNIYHFGNDLGILAASSSVSVLDCRSHTWREAPSMQVKMIHPSASVFDGKIYVAGSFSKDLSESSESIMEVLDTKTQIWDHVPIPYWDGYEYSGRFTKSTCIEGKVYLMIDSKAVAYNPKDGRWDFVEQEMGKCWDWSCNCTIDNVLYSYNYGTLEWYDNKVRLWKQIKGLSEVLPKFTSSSLVKLADYGGKMAVFWKKYNLYSKDKVIWCAVIALERRNSQAIWGKVEWCDAVLTVPRLTQLEYALAATV